MSQLYSSSSIINPRQFGLKAKEIINYKNYRLPIDICNEIDKYLVFKDPYWNRLYSSRLPINIVTSQSSWQAVEHLKLIINNNKDKSPLISINNQSMILIDFDDNILVTEIDSSHKPSPSSTINSTLLNLVKCKYVYINNLSVDTSNIEEGEELYSVIIEDCENISFNRCDFNGNITIKSSKNITIMNCNIRGTTHMIDTQRINLNDTIFHEIFELTNCRSVNANRNIFYDTCNCSQGVFDLFFSNNQAYSKIYLKEHPEVKEIHRKGS